MGTTFDLVPTREYPMAEAWRRTWSTRPDRLTIWPLDNRGFGIDVRWSGGQGNRRATIVRRLLEEAGIQARLTQHVDGRGWELRIGPVPAADVARVLTRSFCDPEP